MKMDEFDEFKKNSNTDEDNGEWEERMRLTPEELAEREAAAQILVEQERARLLREDRDMERHRQQDEKEAEKKRIEKEKKAKRTREVREEKRLRESYKDLPQDLMRVADGLMRRAAFMRVALEDYELDLSENGHVEMFTQSPSSPPYERERPVARLYSTWNASYQKIIKQLSDLVPPAPIIPKEPPAKDEFEKLMERKNNVK